MGYRRPVWVEINLKAIGENIKVLKTLIGSKTMFMAVVKADGYGHGAVKVAQVALESGVHRLGVALVEEGLELRKAGIKALIHILSEIPPSAGEIAVKYDLIPTICSREIAEELSSKAREADKKVKVHVKVDTGMNRLGLFPHQIPQFLEFLKTLPYLEVEGIFTHFAMADQVQNEYTKLQLERFMNLLSDLRKRGFNIPIKHAANSAATILFPETHLDMVRVGIAMYGLHPSPATRGKINLAPALQFKALVSLVKPLSAGEGVSYGLTYRAKKKTTLAVLPLGYGDGYTRLLSNKSHVLIKGRRAPVVGNICMDQLMVDVRHIPVVRPGIEATLIGEQGGDQISADELANILETINYEIVCMIGKRVPRIYIA